MVFPYIFESSDIVNVCAISVTNENDGDSDDSEQDLDDCCCTCMGEVATVLCVALPACKEQQWKSHSFEVGEPREWEPRAG